MKCLLFVAVFFLFHHVTHSSEEDDFCKGISIDDAMVYKGVLTIFRKDHFWEVKDTKIPLTTPKRGDEKKIADHFPGIKGGSIDAISELGDEKSDEFVYVKGGTIHFMKDPKTEDKSMKLMDFMSGTNVTNTAIKNHTTLWYNKVSRHLLIFTGYRYSEFERMSDGQWQVVTGHAKVVRDFKINVYIESAFTVGQSGILISKDWFFTIPLADFKWPGTAYGGQLALGWRRDPDPLGLFSTKEDCGLDEKSYLDLAFKKDLEEGLQDPYEVGIDATYEGLPGKVPDNNDVEPDTEIPEGPGDGGGGGDKKTKHPKKGDGNEEKSNMVWYIVVPIVLLVGIGIAGFVTFMYMRAKKNRRAPTEGSGAPPSRASSRGSPVPTPTAASPQPPPRTPSRGSKRSAGRAKSKSPPPPSPTPAAPVPGAAPSSPSSSNPTTQETAQPASGSTAPGSRTPSRGSKRSGGGSRPSSPGTGGPGEAIEMKPMNLPDVVRK